MRNAHDTYTNEECRAMRNWLLDCCNSEEEIELTEQISNDAVIEHVKKHYDGGIEACLKEYL